MGVSAQLFLVIVAFLVRRATRELHGIPGSCCCDFWTSFCCTFCTITQLVGQLWSRPDHIPGCNFDAGVAGMP